MPRNDDYGASGFPVKTIAFSVVGFFAFIFIVSTLFGSWYTVGQFERGVLTTNGALTAIVDPGLHYKWPFIQGVTMLSNQQRSARWSCPAGATGCNGNGSVMQAYSRDQQPADITVSINYHVPPDQVADVYVNFGSVDNLASRVLFTKAPQQIKTVFGQFDAVSVIQSRAEFNRQATEAVAASVADNKALVIDSVQIENIDFSKVYEQAVEARMTAQVAVQRQEQQLAQERILADIAVTQATGRAASVKAEADANAYKVTIEGNASASAIRARADALTGNPLLVEQTKAERWDGKLPSTMLPNSTVPFFNTDAQTGVKK